MSVCIVIAGVAVTTTNYSGSNNVASCVPVLCLPLCKCNCILIRLLQTLLRLRLCPFSDKQETDEITRAESVK